MILRDYQTALIEGTRAEYAAGHKSVLAVLPTGGGKTVIFCSIARSAAALGKTVIMIMHRHQLIRQTSAALDGTPHGIIRAGTKPDPTQRLQIASVGTLANRTEQYKPDLLIFDEAHHCTAASYAQIVEAYPTARVLGVTATPCRTDGTGLHTAGFQTLIEGPTTAELTAVGYLSPAHVFAPCQIDVKGVKSERGDFAKGALTEACDTPQITGNAIDHYRQHCNRQPAIAFCVSVRHADHVAEQFKGVGYNAAAIHGRHTDEERAAMITDLGAGRLDVLTSCELISEGVDVPVVSCGIMLRPTQSKALALQQMGRVLRTAPGKPHATILDHAGNCKRHGVPTSPQEWTLEGSKRKAGETPMPITTCGECFYVHPVAPRCPNCGHEYTSDAREVQTVQGELERIDVDKVAAQQRREIRRREQKQARTLTDLIALGKARGYAPGWAHQIHKARGRYRRT